MISKNLKEHYSLIDDLKYLKMTMTRDVGVVRSNRRLNRALRRMNLLEKEVEMTWDLSIPTRALIELRNMVQIAQIIIKNNWLDIKSKDDFKKFQNKNPFLLSMGLIDQRKKLC